MGRLAGKVALITGGNSGIGFAVAHRFAAEGAEVFITGRRQAQLENAAAAMDGNVTPIIGDVTDTEGLDQLFSKVHATAGCLDVFVDCAGIAEPASLEDTDEPHFDRHFDLNVRATLFSTQRAASLMSRGSAIVLIGSIAGSIGTPSYGAYGASKAAVRAFTRTWANELARRSIRVNVLSPGPIDTPMFEQATDEVRAALAEQIPLSRLGRPEEVAAAALFLASDESSFITGAELCIDGGMSQV
ncbi:SDR family NAD(P)-dependent oxidoreductase [Halomonas cupida]|uniref:SDR family NAD(P)-dependent oxidoreductase n=1 Tax=Halomonas cupida TaxID=44933 RepID=UPI003A8D1AC1